MSRKMKPTQVKDDILNLSPDRLIEWLSRYDIRPYRSRQIFKWLYMRQADDFDRMTDLGKSVRELLAEHFYIGRFEKVAEELSADGTRKFLFRMNDGRRIESVLIPEKSHYTLCISTQAGCAQGCRFCRTAHLGFERNLTQSEILQQILQMKIEPDDTKRLTNIVLMGMGEPLANYENVLNALNILTNNEYGLKFAGRRITLSTSGIVPRIYDLGADTAVNLAVSLNAADDRTRNMLMPINRKYNIESLMEVCRNYNLRPHRRITIEYIMIKGINDSVLDAKKLSKLLRPIRAKINLIPFNSHDKSQFERPSQKTIETFQNILIDNHYTVMIRESKGRDISAACGQLQGKTQDRDSIGRA